MGKDLAKHGEDNTTDEDLSWDVNYNGRVLWGHRKGKGIQHKRHERMTGLGAEKDLQKRWFKGYS